VEVRVLVELVEDGARRVLEVRGGEDGDGVGRQLFGEVGAALKVLEGGDAGRDCAVWSACESMVRVRGRVGRSHLPRP
jgi:hypothetical protein